MTFLSRAKMCIRDSYMMAEDKDRQIAYIKRADTDVRIATAKPFETQTAYSGGCNWKQ